MATVPARHFRSQAATPGQWKTISCGWGCPLHPPQGLKILNPPLLFPVGWGGGGEFVPVSRGASNFLRLCMLKVLKKRNNKDEEQWHYIILLFLTIILQKKPAKVSAQILLTLRARDFYTPTPHPAIPRLSSLMITNPLLRPSSNCYWASMSVEWKKHRILWKNVVFASKIVQ